MQVAGLLSTYGCACELGDQTNNCAKKWRCSHDFLLRLHNHSYGPRSRTRTCVLDDLGTDVMRSVQLESVLPQAEGIHETCMPTLTPEKV